MSPPGRRAGLTSESILRALESGFGDDLEERLEALYRRSRVPRDRVVLGELALRRGRFAQALFHLQLPHSDKWRDFDRRLLLTTLDLLQSGSQGVSLATIGRMDRLSAMLHHEVGMPEFRREEHAARRVRLARLMASWDLHRASRLAYGGWLAAYLAGEQRLAADALTVIAVAGVANEQSHRAAFALRAERIYLRAGADAHALIARSIEPGQQSVTEPQSPATACVASARDQELLSIECLLAFAATHSAAGTYGVAAEALDQLPSRLGQSTPLTRGRHAVLAAPVYELIGRAVDAERVLVEALRMPLPAQLHARAVLQLAGVRRRAGRPTEAERTLGHLGQAPEEGVRVRRLIELALIRSSSGGNADVVANLLGRAQRIAASSSDPRMVPASTLGTHAALGAPVAQSDTPDPFLRRRPSAADNTASRLAGIAATPLPARISITQAFMAMRRLPNSGLSADRELIERVRLLKHVQSHLGQRRAILVFDALEDAISVTLLRASGSRTMLLERPPGHLQALVNVWSASIEQDVDMVWRELGRGLSRVLLEPILDMDRIGEIEQLIIVPDVGVRGLPFDALPVASVSETYLVEKFSVSRAVSLEALDAAWHRVARTAPALVVLPQRRAAPLLESSVELSSLPGHALTGRQATETALRALVRGAGLVHFGGHAEPVGGGWASGGLGLWADRLTDGVLTFAEILSLDLEGARVVLLGCETGRGRTIGVGPVASPETSLANAFLAAGARNTISTYWRITDGEAQELAREFYSAGGAQGSPVALSLAKRRLLLRFPDLPRLWAAAVWDGAPDRVNSVPGAEAGAR